jgi:hypothetical protein
MCFFCFFGLDVTSPGGANGGSKGARRGRSCKSRTRVGQPVTFKTPLSEPRRQRSAPALRPYSMPCISVHIIVKGKTQIGFSPVVRPCSFIGLGE